MRLTPQTLYLLLTALALGLACSARGGGTGVLPDTDATVTDNPTALPDSPVGSPDSPPPPEDRGLPVDQPAAGCTAPRQMCAGVCVDVTLSPVHCGSCGNRCAGGQMCNNGRCAGGPECAPPRTMCDVCTNVQTDNANCGLCGFRCPTGESCTTGICRPGVVCSPPRMMCAAGCIDVGSDPINCGGCANRCPVGQSCSLGRCTTGTTTTSPAGNACTEGGTECGALECQPIGRSGFCTMSCTHGTATSERSQCGGTGSTCLAQGDGAAARAFCTHACSPAATSGTLSCRSGMVCTGWWYTHAMGVDDTGCFPFCASSSDCAPGTLCNARTGSCSATGLDTTRLPDGSACNPTITTTPPGEMTPRNTQCRGLCFRISSTSPTQGLCGSFLNLRTATSCPDSPASVEPRGPAGEDNLGLCLYRGCARNFECATGLLCVYPEAAGSPVTTAARLCQYATTAQPSGLP